MRLGFFIVVFFSFFKLPAQERQVTIPAPVARFFLEQNDRANLLVKKDSVNTKEINLLNLKIDKQSSIIQSYKGDSVIYREFLSTKDRDIDLYSAELKKAKRETIKQKTLKILAMASTVILTVIAIL